MNHSITAGPRSAPDQTAPGHVCSQLLGSQHLEQDPSPHPRWEQQSWFVSASPLLQENLSVRLKVPTNNTSSLQPGRRSSIPAQPRSPQAAAALPPGATRSCRTIWGRAEHGTGTGSPPCPLLPFCCSLCRGPCRTRAASPRWRPSPPSWGRTACGRAGRAGTAPGGRAAGTPRRTWGARRERGVRPQRRGAGRGGAPRDSCTPRAAPKPSEQYLRGEELPRMAAWEGGAGVPGGSRGAVLLLVLRHRTCSSRLEAELRAERHRSERSRTITALSTQAARNKAGEGDGALEPGSPPPEVLMLAGARMRNQSGGEGAHEAARRGGLSAVPPPSPGATSFPPSPAVPRPPQTKLPGVPVTSPAQVTVTRARGAAEPGSGHRLAWPLMNGSKVLPGMDVTAGAPRWPRDTLRAPAARSVFGGGYCSEGSPPPAP